MKCVKSLSGELNWWLMVAGAVVAAIETASTTQVAKPSTHIKEGEIHVNRKFGERTPNECYVNGIFKVIRCCCRIYVLKSDTGT